MMYSNYTGRSSRSKSTTDVSKLDDNQHPFTSSLPNSGGTLQRRRRQNNPFAPVPPRRTDSISDLRSRSYLNNDFRKKFESTTNKIEESQSPRSSNFVKKLVETLERRQREIGLLDNNGFGGKEEIFKKNVREDKRESLVRENKVHLQVPVHQPTVVEVERYDSGLTNSRVSPRQLEDLQENDDEFSTSSSDDFFPNYWKYERKKSMSIVKSSPISYTTTNKNNTNSSLKNEEDQNQSPSLKSTARRTMKNILSSIKNWKLGKNLPKGSRDYYATRESLGEEMRQFRRDTMPRLVENAVVKNHLNDFLEHRRKDEHKEFTAMIGRGRINDEDDLTRPAIATIHPVYGNKNGFGIQNRFNLKHQERIILEEEKKIEEEVIYRAKMQSVPVQLQRSVQLPPKQTIISSSPPIDNQHQLLRPSKLRDLQKRLSQEIDALASLQKSNLRTSVVYDIPRSNRNIIEEEKHSENNMILQQHTPPEYENIGYVINNDDKRLRSMFTTF